MKKLKRHKRLKIVSPGKLKRPFKRAKSVEEKVSAAIESAPRITNDTLADHREDVLSSARKYIYPLQHSKYRVVRISIGLLALVIIGFILICGLDLYKFQGNSGFIYGVSQILPYPVAKVGGNWVSYESYLFELRRNMHYYSTQQQTNFSSKSGKAQLSHLKEQAMQLVVQDALVNQLAKQHQVTVSDQAVNNEVNLLRQENRLGSSDHVFKEVLSDYWGWSENDFKRELKQQMMQQAVVTKLDTAANQKATSALAQLKGGADFATLAGQLSEDASTKGNGGQYPNPITIDDRDVSPEVTAALFKLKPGQISGIVNTGYTLEIIKLLGVNGNSAQAAHIQFNLQSIDNYLKPLQSAESVHRYIKV